MEKKITIKDIAKEVNVSIRTISRVLNNSDFVKKETRKRILDVIDKYNYKPNQIAQSLRTNISNLIGLITLDLYTPYFAEIIESIERKARLNNNRIVICNSQYIEEEENKILEDLISRMVRGIIINPVNDTYKKFEEIANKGIKIVILGLPPKKTLKNICSVNTNPCYGIREATEYLIKNGHREIIYINGEVNELQNKIRLNSFKDVLRENGINFDKGLLCCSEIHREGGYKVAKKIFNCGKNFTSIMCFNDYIALGVMEYCKEYNIRIPEDVSLIGCDNIPGSEFFNPPLTTIDLPKVKPGEKAVELLFKLIENSEIRDCNVEYPSFLIIRDSVRKI